MSAGFPIGLAVIAVLAQGLFGILPDAKVTPPTVSAVAADITLPSPLPSASESAAAVAMLPEIVTILKQRPKPARKHIRRREHKATSTIRRARPAPIPVRWSVSIRISL